MSDLIRPRFLPDEPIPGPRIEGAPSPNQLMTVRGEAEFYDRRVDGQGAQLGAGSGVTQYPFGARVSGTNLTLRPGTLNNLLPTNIGSTFTISGSGTQYVMLNCVASDGVISSSSIAITSTTPSVIGTVKGFPPNAFGIVLHVLSVGVAFRMIGPGSLLALPIEVFRVQKTMTTPDELPYDSYYTWRVSTT